MGTILIIDDDARLQAEFIVALKGKGHEVLGAVSGARGLALAGSSHPQLVLLEVRLPDMNGLDLYKQIRAVQPRLPTIIMSTFASTDIAIQAMQLGAFEYVLKPFQVADVVRLIEQALEVEKLIGGKAGQPPGMTMLADPLVGNSSAMVEVYKAIGRVATTNVTVLIRGESGTGKELVAKAIHRYSHRVQRPFQEIDCAAIPENLLESELFGYERGAFTGAHGRHIGKIEHAQGGTVFLDEIGEMPLNIQAKILRLLQEKKIQRLGGTGAIAIDARMIAATNRNLEDGLAAKTFREDLYYRLKVVTITIPPLRERREDIPLLVEFFLKGFAQEMQIDSPGISAQALDLLAVHHWPGNVRELANTIQKALIFSRGCRISSPAIAGILREGEHRAQGMTGSLDQSWIRSCLTAPEPDQRYAHLMDEFSRQVVSEALRLTGGNRTRAARMLGISRQALIAKIARHRITD